LRVKQDRTSYVIFSLSNKQGERERERERERKHKENINILSYMIKLETK